MPRIYTTEQNQYSQMVLLFFHCLVYLLVLSFAWSNAMAGVAWLTIGWTALLAYHNYWRYPITEGLQRRTYDRLRNRFGRDWAVGLTAQEFEVERQTTILEAKLRRVVPAMLHIVLVLVALWASLVILQRVVLPVGLITSFWTGLTITFVGVHVRLQYQLRLANRRTDAIFHKKQQPSPPASRLHQPTLEFRPRAGMMFALGDDGEITEVPLKRG